AALKTVALLEFIWVGHHPSYYRRYVRSLLESGCKVVAFCPQPDAVRQWEAAACAEGRLEAYELTDEVQRHRWRRKVPPLALAYRFRQCARRLAAWEAQTDRRVDLVFFACLYSGAAPWGGMDAVFPYPWTGLLLDSACVRVPGWRQRWRSARGFDPLAIFRAQGCHSFATLDGFIRDELSRRTGKPVYVLPEVVDDSPPAQDWSLAETLRGQAEGRTVVGCFGQVARRKGALDFLRLAELCRDEPWFFVWAGPLEEGTFSPAELRLIREHAAEGHANCRFALGRVPDGPEFNALVALCQVLCLRYQGHVGSSNMISKAAAFDKRVLVSDGYCMADQTRRYDLGLCVPEDDTAAARKALGRLLAAGPDLPPACFAEYRAEHSAARFTETVRRMAGVTNKGIFL
ncbi:MAG: hypothetical protein INR62_01045, partial [Rhodospirillales bacterium]|nr:hypothetical protein [Acetobacter sp.]